MCARIIQATQVSLLGRIYHIDTDNAAERPPRWNGPPGTSYHLVRSGTQGRELSCMRWGLVPRRAADDSFAPVNARGESAGVKPTFREAFARRRCVFPVNGWYEWQRQGAGRKLPFVIDAGDDALLHLAAIWEPWRSLRGTIDGFAVITTVPVQAEIAAVHHRQPAVLADLDEVREWLDPATPAARAGELARSPGPRPYRVRRVGFEVNSTRNDGPHLLAAAS